MIRNLVVVTLTWQTISGQLFTTDFESTVEPQFENLTNASCDGLYDLSPKFLPVYEGKPFEINALFSVSILQCIPYIANCELICFFATKYS